MTVKVACPNPGCDASYSVAPEKLGKDARCRKCGTRFTLAGGGRADLGPPTSGLIPEAPPASEPAPGFGLPDPFGRYRIEARLGQGGMGAVYLAHDTELDRKVALKVPGYRDGDPPEVLERFQREARAAARLHHPNLCPVHDVGQVEGVHYLTMAYIPGRTLARVLKERGKPLGEAEAARLVRTLALAIGEAHEAGIIHRDLKPANVMMNARGEPVVLDFGLARRAEDERMTVTGAAMGTPAYMPPEQVEGDPAAIGPASDTYSLGVILYELLTARLPYEGPPTKLMAAILTKAPPPPSTYRPGLDRELERVVRRAMARRPADRFGSMAEFASALGAYLARVEGASTPEPGGPRPGGGRLPGWPFGPRALAAGGAGFLALLGIIVWIATDRGTLKLDVRDPASVAVVLLDGREIELEVLGEPLSIRAGEHDLKVRRRDLEVQTRRFAIRRGGEEVVTVEYTPKAVAPEVRDDATGPAPEAGTGSEVAAGGETSAPVPPAEPGEPEKEPAKVEVAEAPGDGRATAPTPPAAVAEAFEGRQAGEVKRLALGSSEIALGWCPPGSFTMGSPTDEPNRGENEGPVRVTLSRGFWIGRYEVTQALYREVMGTNPSYVAATGGGKAKVAGMDTDAFPVEQVSWEEAVEFCRRLTDRERAAGRLPSGWEYQLPTEAQWEYACRAGTTTATAFGDRLSSRQANFDGNFPYNGAAKGPYLARPAPVGQYASNGWGLHDMHGNVWEWCRDGYQDRLPGGGDPLVAPAPASARVLRGGSWFSLGRRCRSAYRGGVAPGYRFQDFGFRLAAVQSE